MERFHPRNIHYLKYNYRDVRQVYNVYNHANINSMLIESLSWQSGTPIIDLTLMRQRTSVPRLAAASETCLCLYLLVFDEFVFAASYASISDAFVCWMFWYNVMSIRCIIISKVSNRTMTFQSVMFKEGEFINQRYRSFLLLSYHHIQ